MKPERWQQIETLYHAALEHDGSRRSHFLDQACAGDETLRQEVESLLVYDSRAKNFIESPAFEVAAKMIANDPSESAVGRKIGPYHILSHVATGGMGEVYLAEDTRLGRKTVLKILPERFTQDPDRVRRFELEARAASALNHPNILTVYDVGRAEKIHYIAIEFIEGETLRQRMARGKMKLGEVLDIAIQAARALAAAHEAGVLHRDIKPDNIMVRTDGLVKVLDLGLAKLTEVEEAATAGMKTETGVILGTADHMSPEQARGQNVDARTDLFALGVVMYGMIAGKSPFAGETIADIIASLLGEEPLPLSQCAPEIPAALESIVRKTLRKNREERYESAKELLSDLNRLKHRLEFEEELEKTRGQMAAQAAQRPAVGPSRSSQTEPQMRRRKAIDSLAILPLTNDCSDPSMDYFSDGVTESIINLISRLPKLRVLARNTVFLYKDREIDPQEAGRELGVQAVVTGRVRQVEDRLIISAEMTNVPDGSQLWGEQYNRKLSDIFEMQQEIAEEITEKLRLKLSRKEKGRIAKRYTENVEAYHAYLKGRYFWNKRTTESLNKGVEYFKQAIDIDPAYASAYAGLSDSYALLVARETLSPAEGFSKAKAAAAMALKIDNKLGEAHASLAHAMLHNFEWGVAEEGFQRAITLNPGYASAHHWYSEYLLATGRLEEAIAEVKQARELDPLSLIINAHLGDVLYFARQYDQSIEQCLKTLEMDQHFFPARMDLGRGYAQKGMYEKGIAEIQQARELIADSLEGKWLVGCIYAASGKTDEAQKVLEELQEQSRQRYVPPTDIALIYTALGKKDRAFEWLEKAYQVHDPQLFHLKVEPKLDSIRSDPRFADLLRRMGLASPLSGIDTQPPARSVTPRAMAVLPFKPISAESRDEYLELGIADALITKLSDISQVVVRPTSAIRKYVDLEQDPVKAGKELAVESVLEGSIRKLGDRIRVTARLVRVEDGLSLWTGKFDENFTDIFAVEDSISEKVATSLSLKLSAEERERLTKRYTENVEAYHLYLKGRYYWNKRSHVGLNKSIECFQQAIEIEPNYALAIAGLADAYTYLGDAGITAISPREAFSKGRAAAAKALEIDDTLAETHTSLAHLHMHHFEWADAEKEFKRAFELKPNYAAAHQIYSYYLLFMGRANEALSEIKRALELDPLSVPINGDVGNILYYARSFDQAIEQFHKTLEMDAQSSSARLHLARTYEQKGMYEEAILECQTAVTISGRSTGTIASLARVFALTGKRAEALSMLRELNELSKQKYVSPYDMAVLQAALGETDRAFEWLNKAYEERAEWMIYLTVDPRLDSLRPDPRFQNLEERVGLKR